MRTFTAMALIGLLLAGCTHTPFTGQESTRAAWVTAKGLCELGEEISCRQLPYFPLLAKKDLHW